MAKGRFIILMSLEGLPGTMSFNHRLGAPAEQCQVAVCRGLELRPGASLGHPPSWVSSSPTLSPAYPVWESQGSHCQDPTICDSHSEGQLQAGRMGCKDTALEVLDWGPQGWGGVGVGQALSRPQALPLAATDSPNVLGQMSLGKKPKREKATGPLKNS